MFNIIILYELFRLKRGRAMSSHHMMQKLKIVGNRLIKRGILQPNVFSVMMFKFRMVDTMKMIMLIILRFHKAPEMFRSA